MHVGQNTSIPIVHSPNPPNVDEPLHVSFILSAYVYMLLINWLCMVAPKTSRKKSTIQRRGGMDSDDDMEPVDEAFLISHQGHPV